MAFDIFFVVLLEQNRLKTSLWQWNFCRFCPMYSMVALVVFQFCFRQWQYTKYVTHNRASVNGILWLTKQYKWVAANTGTIMCPSVFLSLLLHSIKWLYSLLNCAIPGYGSIIVLSCSNVSILQCYSRKGITLSIKFSSIPRWMVWRILCTITVLGEMHFLFQKTPSAVPTTWYSRYCLASSLSIPSLWVACIIF